ncbi:CBS domain-containing protein [Shimia sp. R9_1]|uniref:CBS domain-containing protein n=1 Tax=unclassified Shimia TaxID=2630038 RepID=UPI001ADC350C|nr:MULTISPECIES: CBS domain-containing protein [unclassified Shimia]MBO9396864.1 CBS domain-containing protein [Shimia sp. R9_2]MBO9401689.1 CBS domain-containing protein [Shimia sp. R9_3]MBO9408096.1 CBS domain-containing protein [Shimia sp. R9_1]
MLVHQILKSKGSEGVLTVKPGTLVSDAAKILSDKGIGTVIVSEDGVVPLGILSERDIVRQLAKRGVGCLSDKIDDYMTTELVTCARNDDAVSVLEKMTQGRFRHMPVMEDGALVGLISLGDTVKARLSELAMEKDALEGMIMGH